MSQVEKATRKSYMANLRIDENSIEQKNINRQRFLPFAFCLLTFALLLSGCRQDMHDNPKYKVYRDGGMRLPPEGTVARGSLKAATTYTVVNSKIQGNPATAAADIPPGVTTVVPTDIPDGEDGFPFKVTAEILDRGQDRYNISCAPCHGRLGDGQGMIALRGFKKPPSYHEDRLRLAPASHFYDVITNGFGAMYNYATEITPEDRWKIAAYIRVLQLSQRAEVAQLPVTVKAQLPKSNAPIAVKPATAEHGTAATQAPAAGHNAAPKPAEAKPAASH